MPGRGDQRIVPHAGRFVAVSAHLLYLVHRICAIASLEWPSLARAGSLRCPEVWPGHRTAAGLAEVRHTGPVEEELRIGPAVVVVEVLRVVRPAA